MMSCRGRQHSQLQDQFNDAQIKIDLLTLCLQASLSSYSCPPETEVSVITLP